MVTNMLTHQTLDGLAAKGMIYTRAISNAPVCAPARTTIISGMYPTSTGAEHMRSMTQLPKGFKMYPVYLRELGYYCTNNSKEDYNLAKDGEVWNEVDGRQHGQTDLIKINHSLPYIILRFPMRVRSANARINRYMTRQK